jgi:hypothetical protein
MEWRDRIFSPPSVDDPHYLNFSPYEPKVHEPVRQAMMTDAKKLEQEEEEVLYIFNAIQQNIIIISSNNYLSYIINNTGNLFLCFRYAVETVSH